MSSLQEHKHNIEYNAPRMTSYPPIDEKWLDKPRAKRKSIDDENDSKTKKQHNGNASDAKIGVQTNLFTFFSVSPKAKKKSLLASQMSKAIEDDQSTIEKQPARKLESTKPLPRADVTDKSKNACDEIPGPMIPKTLNSSWNSNATWMSVEDDMIIIRKPRKEKPRDKVAAFDVDGTLFVWKTMGYPSQLNHYELWASTVPGKMRELYDEGFKLLLVTNQGSIQTAHNGKKATLIKTVIDWLAHLVDRPIHVVMSTISPKSKVLLKKTPKKSFHKPSGKMWDVAIANHNKREPFDISTSFFVGDSADPTDEQGGVDFRFAQAVSDSHSKNGSTLKFFTPTQYFGPSDDERRKRLEKLKKSTGQPPVEALAARSALLGGYLKEPLVLILCGVQGSGKSTFSRLLLEGNDNRWVHLSQDTINNGKPGKREKVEEETRIALNQGKSVVVDRMHLDKEQRDYFIGIANDAKVPAHAIVFDPPKEVITKRVRERKNHIGGVMGDEGVKIALRSNLIHPIYEEGFCLISNASTPFRVQRLANLYKRTAVDQTISLLDLPLSESVNIPLITLGTMGIKRDEAQHVLQSVTSVGIRSVDTAPSYRNEAEIGLHMISNDLFCIAKIPKSAITPESVRTELNQSLEKLQRSNVDLLLLHWPCDVMVAGSLSQVWKEMEECLNLGLCKSLGVCNFNANALASLLCNCSIPPAVNQIERHPLLSQMDLVDFCEQKGIFLQAHSPLGQGKHELLGHPVIQKISAETSMSPAQVALRWNLQHGVLVAPKCSSKEHAQELVSTKPLSPEQMKLLDSLNQGKRFVAPPFMYGKHSFCW